MLCAPALGMKTENLGMEKQFGSDAPLTVAYKEITGGVPGRSGPGRRWSCGPTTSTRPASARPSPTSAQLADSGRFGKAVEVELHAAQNVARIEVPLAGNGETRRSKRALDTLRDDRCRHVRRHRSRPGVRGR